MKSTSRTKLHIDGFMTIDMLNNHQILIAISTKTKHKILDANFTVSHIKCGMILDENRKI